MKALLILIFLTTAFSTSSFAQCLNVTSSSTNVNCVGGIDGTITLTPTSGQAPYTYTWNTGTITLSGAYTINGLSVGTYSVTVEDNLGCDMITNMIITQPLSALSINTSVTSNYNGADISCSSSCDGEAIVTASGGTGAYTYNWSDGSILQSITAVCAGVYYVTVVDANGCSAADSVELIAPSPISAAIANFVNVDCHGSCSGSATATSSGGVGMAYTYLWSVSTGSQTATTATNLCAGTHCVTVTDFNGCMNVACVTISEPSLITVGLNATSASCHGICDGSFTITANGGTTPYAYSIDGGITFSSTSVYSNLCAGQYIVDIQDVNGCIATDTILVAAPDPISIQIVIQDTICQGTSTSGNLLGIVTGGSPGYTYLWSHGTINNPTSYSTIGTYCLEVTDANGCTATDCSFVDTLNFEINITNAIISGNQKYGISYQNNPQVIQTESSYPSQTTYNWSPATGLSCTTCPNPTVAPVTIPTQYILNANHNTLGCTSSDTIIIYPHFTDTIRIELTLDSSINYCSNYPPFFSGATSTAVGPLSYGSITYGLLGCFDYTNNGNEGIDTILWIDCATVNVGVLPVQICDTTVIYLSTTSCVWPGDTDKDGITNNFDLLPIGQHHGTAGLTRANATINYNCQPSLNWGTSILGIPTVDLKHVDTDGNAIINSNDTNAIILNWAQTHLRNNNNFLTGIDLYVDTATTTPGDIVRLPIILGSTSVPNGYGIAFTVNYNPAGIDTNTVSIDFNNSWLGAINSDMIGIQKDFYYQGQTEVALTRINQVAVTGSGAIAHITFTIKDDVLPKSAFLRLDFNITNIRFIDPFGTIIPVTGVPTQVLVTDGLTETETISSKQENALTVFPNPTTAQVQIQSLVEEIETILIYNLTGTLLHQKENINTLSATLDLKMLPTGIYIANVISEKGMQTVRIIKK